jgi:hypothetical protein
VFADEVAEIRSRAALKENETPTVYDFAEDEKLVGMTLTANGYIVTAVALHIASEFKNPR